MSYAHSGKSCRCPMKQLDLNLLMTFDAMLREQSVTRAADTLGVTQSALSHSLNRLRAYFDDPLFVKGADGMVPTRKAESLRQPVADVMASIRQRILSEATFDPSSAERTFTFCMTDMGELVFLPPLVNWFAKLAPKCRIRTLQVPTEQIAGLLASGEADLALGSIRSVPEGLYRQRLFLHTFATIVSASNTSVGQRLTMKQFERMPHVVVSLAGKAGDAYDNLLEEHGVKRNIFLTTPHFLSSSLPCPLSLLLYSGDTGPSASCSHQFHFRRSHSISIGIRASIRIRQLSGCGTWSRARSRITRKQPGSNPRALNFASRSGVKTGRPRVNASNHGIPGKERHLRLVVELRRGQLPQPIAAWDQFLVACAQRGHLNLTRALVRVCVLVGADDGIGADQASMVAQHHHTLVAEVGNHPLSFVELDRETFVIVISDFVGQHQRILADGQKPTSLRGHCDISGRVQVHDAIDVRSTAVDTAVDDDAAEIDEFVAGPDPFSIEGCRDEARCGDFGKHRPEWR
jgi:DNA-binding transcriptional LysR family regulator